MFRAMNFAYVCILISERDGQTYVGKTDDLHRLLKEHQSGQNISTAKRPPVRLIFYEAYPDESDALRRERCFKTAKGKVTLRAMLTDCFSQ